MTLVHAVATFLLSATLSLHAAPDGLVTVRSPRGVAPTMDTLASLVRRRGLTIFARIDHADGAARVNRSLRPTELLIFGNPAGGTPLMECAQTAAIDLPLKALVWEDADGRVWLGYNDPAWLAARHGVASCPAVADLSRALASLVAAAVVP